MGLVVRIMTAKYQETGETPSSLLRTSSQDDPEVTTTRSHESSRKELG
jgi:hypothetical protein